MSNEPSPTECCAAEPDILERMWRDYRARYESLQEIVTNWEAKHDEQRRKIAALEAALAEAQQWAKDQQAGKVGEQKRRVYEVTKLQAEVERLRAERDAYEDAAKALADGERGA